MIVFVLATGASSADLPDEKPTDLVIGLDVSASTLLLTNSEYATKVAQRVGSEIQSLRPRSRVTLRSFGTYESKGNELLRYDVTISSVNRPETVEQLIETIITSIPLLVRRGTIKPQMQTNILGFLDNRAQLTECERYKTLIVLVSDGMEDSELGQLTRLDSKLPLPSSRIFNHCDKLQILGIGTGSHNHDPAFTDHLRQQWLAWAAAAGFVAFEALNDW